MADTFEKPFASAIIIPPANGVSRWTDNVSHVELIRSSHDETIMIDSKNMKFVFQEMLEETKRKTGFGNFQWRTGMLEPKTETEKLLSKKTPVKYASEIRWDQTEDPSSANNSMTFMLQTFPRPDQTHQ